MASILINKGFVDLPSFSPHQGSTVIVNVLICCIPYISFYRKRSCLLKIITESISLKIYFRNDHGQLQY